MIDIVCKSCLIGCSDVSKEEIENQTKKYEGIYICKDCEEVVKNISNGTFGKLDKDGHKYLITSDGVYIDKGMRSRNEKFLGYGGRLFLIVEDVNDGFITKKKAYLTNNLFSVRNIHSSLVKDYKDKINAKIIQVDWDSFDILKAQLDKIK